MRTPLKIMLAIVVLAGLVAAPAFAAKTQTTVTVQGLGTSHGGDIKEIGGEVSSSKVSCMKDRKVTAYRVQPGKDKRLGAERTFKNPSVAQYLWRVEVDHLPVGKYYGVAKETRKCRGDKSEKFKLTEAF